MSEVKGMVQAGDDVQGVVVAPGVCGYVTSSGCAGVAAPWICVSLVVVVPVLRCRWCVSPACVLLACVSPACVLPVACVLPACVAGGVCVVCVAGGVCVICVL
jgi:hypothetical protein